MFKSGLAIHKLLTSTLGVKRSIVTSGVLLQTKLPTSPPGNDPFLNGASGAYIEEMFDAWSADPGSVHKSWDEYFRSVQAGRSSSESRIAPLAHRVAPSGGSTARTPAAPLGAQDSLAPLSQQHLIDTLSVQLIIRSFQTRGHHIAELDPLNINNLRLYEMQPPELKLSTYGLTEKDLDREFMLPPSTYIGGTEAKLPLREILERLKKIYCGHIGVEYMHITKFDRMNWIRERFETPGIMELSADKKRSLFRRLLRSSKFEAFLARKWPSEKRFGLEGCEVMIPALKQIIDYTSARGVDTYVIGMAHRGRLNVLANVCTQSLAKIFDQFQTLAPEEEGSGDVKYHLGVSVKRFNIKTEKDIEISMMANPSHLECVGPVALGKTKSHQFYANDKEGHKSIPILIHGDAAFSGQGVVYETFDLSQLENYTCHGVIHIVVNNQVGFTTDPRFGRSSPYCTDVGRVVNCPIFHVNADDPEAVMHVSNVAAEWRQKFNRDVVIDLVGYRRFGHSEVDEPMFTQPIMYSRIKKQKPVFEAYAEKLMSSGIITKEFYKQELETYNKVLEDSYSKAKLDTKMKFADWIDSPWDEFYNNLESKAIHPLADTGVKNEMLKMVGEAACAHPTDFNVHPGLARFMKLRAEMVGKRIADWALGEALAFGTLMVGGVHVRLSGQDSERGAFSHRHYVLHDQKVDKKVHVALNNISAHQAEFSVCNSPLNEYGVLSFEYGYSLTSPNSLVCWEAQFGDFANVAQCTIDQFVSSGESKWIRQCGIVLLLPHGYEGMGPEHSTAHLERFLQSCNDDARKPVMPPSDPNFEMKQLQECNWFIVNCTTPANYFHVLRRQIMLPFRKPLVIMTPKSLLRHPSARSSFDEFLPGTGFRRLIPETPNVDTSKVDRLVFCSGKIYYEMAKERDAQNLKDKVVIHRIEQISPFPYDLIDRELKKYPNAKLIWSQEEHMNMGAWAYIEPRFATATDGKRRIKYTGREPSASTATGNKYLYLHQQCQAVADALDVPFEKLKTMSTH